MPRGPFKSVETKFMEEREAALRSLGRLDRRGFAKVSGRGGAFAGFGIQNPHSFQPIQIANAAPAEKGAKGVSPSRSPTSPIRTSTTATSTIASSTR